ncbi:DUF222 domain-containing protein [Microbacterium sp. P06]|uniref:HNH endonuclease signature motif containing protein n=1 Tax=Microbacterium sp. P06 TaxID=3366949 RepID=UPI00374510C7
MEDLLDRLGELGAQLRAVAGAVLSAGVLRGASEAEIVAVMDAAASAIRPLEGVVIEAAGQVHERSDNPGLSDRMTTRFGCRTPRELVERVTRVSGRRAGDYVAAGRAIVEKVAPTSGVTLPAPFPAMRAAVTGSVVGVDAVVAVTGVLGPALPAWVKRGAADTELSASARGEGVDGAPPATADQLKLQAQVWAMYLDQDGAEPREARANRKRGITLGKCHDGLVPVRGNVLPEVAAQWQLLEAAILNPKLRGPRFLDPDGESEPADIEAGADTRTSPQKRHDAFATILSAAARSSEMPTLGGAAPTLVVSVDADDLQTGRGFAHVDGITEPVSLSVARHVACCGNVQRVFQNKKGRIIAIDIADRVFNRYQRRALQVRDGACIIPGCTVPAIWCEIHHVDEAANGGPTHTDNGVLLCWHHHRTLDTGGWQIRMNNGVPEVRAPGWREPYLQWRAVTKSPAMLRRKHAARMRAVVART